jgi:hypothetical protein
MQYEKEQTLDPPEYHDKPEREYDENLTDRFDDTTAHDCMVASEDVLHTVWDEEDALW